jgi:tetratricopeptide (TPR) repeat protein
VAEALCAALAAAERLGDSAPLLAACLDDLLALAIRDARHDELDRLIERRVAIAAEDPRRAEILGGLALRLRAARQHARAEPLAREALRLLDQTAPPTDPRLEQALDTLASIALRLGHASEAEAVLTRLLAVEERRGNGLELAATLNRLAQVKRMLGKNVEASDLDERVAALREASKATHDAS